MSKEAMKLALEKSHAALKRMARFGNTFGYRSNEQNPYEQVCEAIAAIEALAEQPAQQEPVAWRVKWPAIGGGYKWMMVDRPLMEKEGFVNEALYTSPPSQRTWVGMTDDEVMESWGKIRDGDWAPDFYAVIEANLKEKNT